jgi:glycosyltransferase involved in cell wall biosynthesis
LLKCSVVIPVYNGAHHLRACLQALQAQTVSAEMYEVIVVEDGSTDDSLHLRRDYPVRWLRQRHQGPAVARNTGIAAARGELVLFTDADCEPAPNWVEAMCAPFQEPHVSGAKGVYGTHQPSLVARFAQAEYEDKYRRMGGRATIDFVDTYSAAYRRHALMASGGFDTCFPMASVEDQELSFRLAKAGHRLVFQPDAVVYHQHPATVWAYARRKYIIGYWKVLVHERHPDKLVKDSHTPQVLKLQMMLVAVLLPLLVLATIWLWLWLLVGIVAFLMAVTMVPFIVRVWRTDRMVALVVPSLLVVRALALGAGFAAGLVRQRVCRSG